MEIVKINNRQIFLPVILVQDVNDYKKALQLVYSLNK